MKRNGRWASIVSAVAGAMLLLVMALPLEASEPGNEPQPERTHEPIYCGWAGPVWVCVP